MNRNYVNVIVCIAQMMSDINVYQARPFHGLQQISSGVLNNFIHQQVREIRTKTKQYTYNTKIRQSMCYIIKLSRRVMSEFH